MHRRPCRDLGPSGSPPSIRRTRRDGAPAERELVLKPELQDDGIARTGETASRAGDELEPAREPPVDRRKDVVLLLLGPLDRADLPDAAVELDPGDEPP